MVRRRRGRFERDGNQIFGKESSGQKRTIERQALAYAGCDVNDDGDDDNRLKRGVHYLNKININYSMKLSKPKKKFMAFHWKFAILLNTCFMQLEQT